MEEEGYDYAPLFVILSKNQKLNLSAYRKSLSCYVAYIEDHANENKHMDLFGY